MINRNDYGGHERDVPDIILQREMLTDACINEPATVILLTGDGAGWNVRKGFMNTLQCTKKRGWEVELLSAIVLLSSFVLHYLSAPSSVGFPCLAVLSNVFLPIPSCVHLVPFSLHTSV